MPYNTFPAFIGVGWDIKKKILFSTSTDTSASGAEFRTNYWPIPHYEFRLQFNFLSQADMDTLEAFYVQQLGSGIPFLLSVPNSTSFTNKYIGSGTVLTKQIQLPAQSLVVSTAQVVCHTFQGDFVLWTTPRTNLFLQSQAFDNASWTSTKTTETADTAVAPDGNTTADTLKEDATLGGHYISQSVTVANGSKYTVSIWVKETGAGSKRYFTIGGMGAWASNQIAEFDCSGSGTVLSVTGGGSASITPYANGWYYCRLTTAATNGTAASIQLRMSNSSSNGIPTYTGDNTSSFYLWGAQMELGTVATQYIITTTAQVTDPGYTVSDSGLVTLGLSQRANADFYWTGTYAFIVRFKDEGLETNQLMNMIYEQKGITFRTVR